MTVTAALLTGSTLAAAGLLCAALLFRRLRKLEARLSQAESQRDRALAGEAAATRLLRLSAYDLRDRVMGLLGHAEQLRKPGCADTAGPAAAIAAVAEGILGLADEMQDHEVADASTRRLDEEPVDIGALVQHAVASVAPTLGPSSRNWRIAPELQRLMVHGDRRALFQVLVRVLANGARFSRDGDWIDVSLCFHHRDALLVIADEGAGVPTQEGDPFPGQRVSRGLGLGLSTARVLMEAHGGALTIESAPRIGTRVTLTFPSRRVIVRQQLVA